MQFIPRSGSDLHEKLGPAVKNKFDPGPALKKTGRSGTDHPKKIDQDSTLNKKRPDPT